MAKAQSVVDTVLGEARAGDFEDMVGIVSVIDNRSKALGVSYQSVVAAPGQFDAFGKSLPAGVGKYRDMAMKAIETVRSKGPVHTATFYATPAAAKGLPRGLAFETKTRGHNYYSDPKGRAIATTEGYKTPDMTALAQNYAKTPEVGPTPTSRPEIDPTATAYAPAAEVDTSPFDAVMGVARGPEATGQLGFKSEAAKTAVASMAPEGKAMLDTISRGLPDPGAYTVTSTAEARPGLASLTHVRDAKAIDARTRGLDTKALDDLAVAGLYSRPTAIGWDAKGFAPHAHFDVSGAYGKGLSRSSDISKLSPDVQGMMAYYDEAMRSGSPYAPPVPEPLAPTPTPAPRSATVERGLLSDVTPAMTQDYSVAPGLMANIDQASLAAPAMTGPAARGVSTQSITPDNPTVASQQRGRVDPSASQMAGLAQALNDQAASLQSKDQEGLFGGLVSSAAAATQEQAGAAGRAMGALAGPETQAFSQQAFNDMTGPIGMPVAGPSFGPMETMDDAKRDADTLGRENAVLSGLEAAAKRDAEAARAAPTAPAGPQMGIAGTQSSAPSAPTAPTATAADVWGGKATVGTATNGNQVSRNPDGTISMTSSKYGYTDTYAPDGSFRGTTAPGLFGIDDAAKGLFGGFGKGTQAGTAQATAPARSFSDAMESFSGKGAMRGAMMGAPAGLLGLVAGALMGGFGKKGQQAAPTGLFSGGIMTADEAARAYALGYTPGLGFPANPGGPTQGGLTAKGEAASRGEFGGQAAHAADNPGTGLF
jgi:hypothetical protein